jgi:quercetin dioxygenase-like cupin family protein
MPRRPAAATIGRVEAIRKGAEMLKPGDSFENPVTGEHALIRATGRETRGEPCTVEMTVRPGGGVFVAHVHPSQEERFRVLDGTVEVAVDGRTVRAAAGDEVVAAPGQAHSWRNAGPDEARLVIELRPALRFDAFLDDAFRLARAGKTDASGRVRPLHWARVGRRYRAEFRLPGPPLLYDVYLAIAAPLARLLGVAPA